MSEPPQSSRSITRIAVEEFTGQCRRHLTPLTAQVSYFQAISLDEEQQRQFLRDPVQAIPTAILDRVPPLRLILVPYLEKGPAGSAGLVAFERPEEQRLLNRTVFDVRDEIFLLFAVEQQDVGDYHNWLFQTIAGLAAQVMKGEEFTGFGSLVLDELNRGARGEVDEPSLQLKQKLQRLQRLPGRNSKMMRGYIRQALEDTLLLYLHGLCCDIEVDPGSRQLGSRYLRERLLLLAEIYPPNPGHLLFPAPPDSGPAPDNGQRT